MTHLAGPAGCLPIDVQRALPIFEENRAVVRVSRGRNVVADQVQVLQLLGLALGSASLAGQPFSVHVNGTARKSRVPIAWNYHRCIIYIVQHTRVFEAVQRATATPPHISKLRGCHALRSCPVALHGRGGRGLDLVVTILYGSGRTPRGHVPLRREPAPGTSDLCDLQALGGNRTPVAGQGDRPRGRGPALRAVRDRLVRASRFLARHVSPQDGRGRRHRPARVAVHTVHQHTAPMVNGDVSRLLAHVRESAFLPGGKVLRKGGRPGSGGRERIARPAASLRSHRQRRRQGATGGVQPADHRQGRQAPQPLERRHGQGLAAPRRAGRPDRSDAQDDHAGPRRQIAGAFALLRLPSAEFLSRSAGELRFSRHGPGGAGERGGRIPGLLHGLFGRRAGGQVQRRHAGLRGSSLPSGSWPA